MLSLFTLIWASSLLIFAVSIPAQQKETVLNAPNPGSPGLVEAEMCEGVEGQNAVNAAVVFSKTKGSVYCLTIFDTVSEKTFIYHDWYFRDERKRHVKLFLQSPRWATFSRTEIREADIGPWRVEIRNDQDNILAVLRFSITD
jgi:hypothetical protein